ncbi:hypothetical protein QYE76_060684 [Lolium multiflorum]|uniref:C2H2-type domain-containing protein n=1 Tax=Lolium multiflorum TaxID=4521 RepID=A0AAD8S0C1_LOLMU|nr:hypothetical protein QYE76_060684 [Lolium multiflorum]
MKHQRAASEQAVSLALSLGAVADRHKKLRRAGAAAVGSGEFVCKTCSRSFPTFQALGGHRTSHLRGRHGLALVLAGDHYNVKHKKTTSTDDQKPAAAPRGGRRGGAGAASPAPALRLASLHPCAVRANGFDMGKQAPVLLSPCVARLPLASHFVDVAAGLLHPLRCAK